MAGRTQSGVAARRGPTPGGRPADDRALAARLGCHPLRLAADTGATAGDVALAQDTINLMDAFGLESAAIVGHDWGAGASRAAVDR